MADASLITPPPVYPWLERVLQGFYYLSPRRPVHVVNDGKTIRFHPMPIPTEEVAAWLDIVMMEDPDERTEFATLIAAADSEWIKHRLARM